MLDEFSTPTRVCKLKNNIKKVAQGTYQLLNFLYQLSLAHHHCHQYAPARTHIWHVIRTLVVLLPQVILFELRLTWYALLHVLKKWVFNLKPAKKSEISHKKKTPPLI